MRKIIRFGKIAYSTASKLNDVDVIIDYKVEDDKKVLSICGEIWSGNHTDTVSGGQNLDTIAMYIDTDLFKKIYRLWKLYHLNDMHPECEHQRELGWLKIARTEVNIYHYLITNETSREKRRIEKLVIDNAKKGIQNYLTNEERLILNLEYGFESSEEHLLSDLSKYYKQNNIDTRRLGFLKEFEHPDGILCKPCPVCGYKYGTSWNYVPIPKEDEKILLEILGLNEF